MKEKKKQQKKQQKTSPLNTDKTPIREGDKATYGLNKKNKESICSIGKIGKPSAIGEGNSFIPAIQESERFIKFLIKRFDLPIKNDYVFTINKANKNTIGFFMPKEHPNHYINTTQDLNNINLNTLHLKNNSPFECITHEIAHFLNKIEGIKGCSSNQYHNKHFKAKAEFLLLECVKSRKGYAETHETDEFIKMLEEFKPNKDAFNICQANEDKKKVGSRLKLWECDCGVKVRSARDLNIKCLDCNSKFVKVEE